MLGTGETAVSKMLMDSILVEPAVLWWMQTNKQAIEYM